MTKTLKTKTQQKMKLTKATTELICELEYIIGNECYNPNSLNGYTWEEGLAYRYPIHYEDKNGIDSKTKSVITDTDKTKIDTIRYEFGSNYLYIGNALVKVLERLEAKYGLDFNELTKKTPSQPKKSNDGILRAKIVKDTPKIIDKFK